MAVIEGTRPAIEHRRGGPALRIAPSGRQRNVPWMVMGALLVVGGALLFALIASRLAGRQPILALARSVPAGQVIAASDLKVVRISVDGELRGIPAADRRDVLGRPAVTDLGKDTLLTRDDVGAGSGLSRGKAIVGLGLKSGQLPTQDLAAGARVVILDTGELTGGGTTAPKALAEGRVTDVKKEATGASAGTVVVSVVVEEADAPAIAAANAGGRIAIVLVSA
jgi:hypothetical protein